jgi:GT2 family glycosyltransferase
MTLSYSVVVPLRGTAATLEQTLASIKLSMAGSSYPGELLLILSGDEDTTPVPNLEGVKLLRAGLGRSQARNAGWQATHGEVVIFVDADCAVPPSFIQDCVFTLENNSASGVAYPLAVKGSRGGYVQSLLQAHYSWLTQGTGLSLYRTGTFGRFIDTAACAFRRRDLQAVGGFDNELARSEDVDLSYRISTAGGRFTWVDGPPAVKHYDFISFLEILKWSWESGMARTSLYRKYYLRTQRAEIEDILKAWKKDWGNTASLKLGVPLSLGLWILLSANRIGSLRSMIKLRP